MARAINCQQPKQAGLLLCTLHATIVPAHTAASTESIELTSSSEPILGPPSQAIRGRSAPAGWEGHRTGSCWRLLRPRTCRRARNEQGVPTPSTFPPGSLSAACAKGKGQV